MTMRKPNIVLPSRWPRRGPAGLLAASVSGFLLSGCMMPVGMHSGGMRRMDVTPSPMTHAAKVEARSAHVQASLEFPPVSVGNQGTLTVEVRDSLGRPFSAAAVAVRLDHGSGDGEAGIMLTGKPSSPGSAKYQVTHRFNGPGHYVATAEVTVAGRDSGNALTLTAHQDVLPATAMDAGHSNARSVAILTGALMAGAMALMFLFGRT